MASSAKLVKAVIFGGVALVVGLIMGLLLEGFVDDLRTRVNDTAGETSTAELILDNFLVIWIMALLVAVFVVVLRVSDVMD